MNAATVPGQMKTTPEKRRCWPNSRPNKGRQPFAGDTPAPPPNEKKQTATPPEPGGKCRTRTAKGLFFSWEQAMPETLSFTL